MSERGTARESPPKAGHRGELEELRLVALIRSGDVQAFKELYGIYHPRLTRFLFNLVHQPQIIEEIADDTLMVVWQRSHTFNAASKLSTWIFGIAYRTAMKALRRWDEPIEDPAMESRASETTSPEDECGRRRMQTLVMDAMRELSAEHRTVVDLTYFHEIGYREIAAIMDCPVETVKTRMFYARRHLKRRLAGELADWL